MDCWDNVVWSNYVENISFSVDTFLHRFSQNQKLLGRIQSLYVNALVQGLRCSDNVTLRSNGVIIFDFFFFLFWKPFPDLDEMGHRSLPPPPAKYAATRVRELPCILSPRAGTWIACWIICCVQSHYQWHWTPPFVFSRVKKREDARHVRLNWPITFWHTSGDVRTNGFWVFSGLGYGHPLLHSL